MLGWLINLGFAGSTAPVAEVLPHFPTEMVATDAVSTKLSATDAVTTELVTENGVVADLVGTDDIK